MNLDELQSVQARERQSSDLQHLRPSFYREVGEFVERLSEKRARAVEAADDPFSSPEVRRLTDDIETAEQTVEEKGSSAASTARARFSESRSTNSPTSR